MDIFGKIIPITEKGKLMSKKLKSGRRPGRPKSRLRQMELAIANITGGMSCEIKDKNKTCLDKMMQMSDPAICNICAATLAYDTLIERLAKAYVRQATENVLGRYDIIVTQNRLLSSGE